MSRSIRNTVILAKIETTAGTDASPTGAADAVLVSNLSARVLEANNVDRDLIRAFFGSSEQLVGTKFKRLSFTVELAGSGAAVTAPQWGDLLQGCAFAEASLGTPNRVEYTPITVGLKTLTLYYYDSGILHKLLGAMGNVKLSAKVGERPTMAFDFIGVDGGDTSVAVVSPTYTAWKKPVTMTKDNVTDIAIGCTYAAGALSGGTVYSSTGIEVDLANQVAFIPLLSSERVDLTDRQASGKVMFDLSADDEVTFLGNVKTNLTQAMGMVIGTASGNKIVLHMPNVQLINHSKEEVSGSRLIGFDMRITPSASGNDDIRIVCV